MRGCLWMILRLPTTTLPAARQQPGATFTDHGCTRPHTCSYFNQPSQNISGLHSMASSSTGDVLNPSQTLQTAASMGRRATAERSVTARRGGLPACSGRHTPPPPARLTSIWSRPPPGSRSPVVDHKQRCCVVFICLRPVTRLPTVAADTKAKAHPPAAAHLPPSAAGSRLVVLVSDNHATKLAVKMACSLLRPRDELQLLTVVMSDSARAYGEKLLSQYTFDGDESNFCTPIVRGLLQPAARSLQHAACSMQAPQRLEPGSRRAWRAVGVAMPRA